MRGSIWVLIILTLLVGVWVMRDAWAGKAKPLSQAPSPTEIALDPVVNPDPCLKAPEAEVVSAPQIPASLPGHVGLFVARFEPGQRDFKPSKIVQINADEVFPLASNYKTSVWLEVLRQVDAGKIDLNEKFVVTPANQSLGDYPYDNTPVEGLAMRMIMWSDNTATDLLHRRIGLQNLQPLADQLGLCKTRLLLPTKAWWTAEAGLGGPDFPKDNLLSSSLRFANAKPQERLEIAHRLDAAAQEVGPEQLNKAVQPYFESKQWERMAQIDAHLQNATTPLEWARFFWMAFTQNGLSAQSDALFRKVMFKGYGSRFLKVRYKYYGGKSGNTAGVLGFTGFLESEDGCRYIYIFLSDEVPEVYTGYFDRPAFSLINGALKAVGMPGKG